MTTTNSLHRSGKDRMLTGVSGGLAEYFDADPTLVRLAWVVLCFVTAGLAIFLYIILAVIMPMGETTDGVAGPSAGPGTQGSASDAAGGLSVIEEHIEPEPRRADNRGRDLFALFLIVVGCLVLLASFDVISWFGWSKIWPLVLIGIGATILVGRSRRN